MQPSQIFLSLFPPHFLGETRRLEGLWLANFSSPRIIYEVLVNFPLECWPLLGRTFWDYFQTITFPLGIFQNGYFPFSQKGKDFYWIFTLDLLQNCYFLLLKSGGSLFLIFISELVRLWEVSPREGRGPSNIESPEVLNKPCQNDHLSFLTSVLLQCHGSR